ncbi:MAG: hypothetical protein IPH69_15345 [Bacteroidales bacterium]|nr:hypothetical protein [Bacteroidales bacterium]
MELDMKGVIFRNDWHLLSQKQIDSLFNENFADVAIQPGIDIVKRLKMMEVCTLEILEDRSRSTVYRIRQTDEVFQIFQSDGKLFTYTTEDYYLQKPTDELVKEYSKKDPIFKIEKVSDFKEIIHHLKSPKFRALFVDGTYDRMEWIDQPPEDISQIEKLMKKMGAFYTSYVKK